MTRLVKSAGRNDPADIKLAQDVGQAGRSHLRGKSYLRPFLDEITHPLATKC